MCGVWRARGELVDKSVDRKAQRALFVMFGGRGHTLAINRFVITFLAMRGCAV